MEPQVLWLLAGGALFALAVRCYLAGRYLRKVRGPPSPSWLVGNIEEIDHQPEVGNLENKWSKEYGTAWRVKGCMGEDEIMICDPKALQYILHKSGYHFPKTTILRQILRELTGRGILYAKDKDHARIRKIMNPAFDATQLKSFLPLFHASAQKLRQKWEEQLATTSKSSQRINVLFWLSRCSLDIIGEVGFDVQCGAMDNSLNPIMKAYQNMFADALPFPSRSTTLFRSFWKYIPMSILALVQYIPTKDHTRFRRTLKVVNNFSNNLIDEKTDAILAGEVKKKDIMSILINANASEDPKSRLTNEEMISQMATFLHAGQEGTGSSMTWLLYELARNSEYQSKIRDEVKAIRARMAERGDADFSMSDLESMTHCLAAIKEALRLHPMVYVLPRMASRDDVLPLANPITTTDGELVEDVPIPRGTTCVISVWLYNRLPQIWGADANEFNPYRFIENEKTGETYVGVTSNLMTFGSGLQGCIGWRFSMIVMQAILVELIEHFEFSVPEDKPEMICFPAGVVVPLVKSDMQAGPQMPLQVSLV